MADDHTSGAERKDLNSSLLDHKIYGPNKSKEEESGDRNLWSRSLAQKWILILFMGTCLLYCARMAMPVCAVSMAAMFHWSKIDSGLVLGGFFWGYCLTQILGGHASDKMGGERVLFFSASSWALITVGTPLLAHLGSHTLALMTLARFLMGLSQGVFFPSLASLCSQRVVEGERGFLMSAMQSGTHLGTLLAGGLGTLMLDCCGWESVFCCISFLSALWALIVWQCLPKGMCCLNLHLPLKAAIIHTEQFAPVTWTYFRKYLNLFLDELIPKINETKEISERSLSRTRWLSLFKKPPVWAMVFAHMCVCSTSYTLLSWLPTYFKESFPHATGWVYNVVPWITAIPTALGGGYVSDFLINRGYAVASVRKIMQFFAMGASSMFILPLAGVVTFPSAVTYISAAVGFSTFTSGGVSVNVQDLTPSCAGALFGFMNMMGSFMGLVLVSVSGYLIEVTHSWATVFALITLVNSTGLGIFLIFGGAHRVDKGDYSQIIEI